MSGNEIDNVCHSAEKNILVPSVSTQVGKVGNRKNASYRLIWAQSQSITSSVTLGKLISLWPQFYFKIKIIKTKLLDYEVIWDVCEKKKLLQHLSMTLKTQ